jgi:hypothetical protein
MELEHQHGRNVQYGSFGNSKTERRKEDGGKAEKKTLKQEQNAR